MSDPPAAASRALRPGPFRRAGRWAGLALVLALAACADAPTEPDPACDPSDRTVLCVEGHALTVEIADEPGERLVGLSDRDAPLAEDRGMLFVFAVPGTIALTMAETSIPLSAAFVDTADVIVNVEEMEPFSGRSYRSDAPAIYAIETNQGWFAEHGVSAGDTVRFGPCRPHQPPPGSCR